MSRQWIVGFEKGKARAELIVLLRVLDALEIELTASPTGATVVSPPTIPARARAQDPTVVDLGALLDEHVRSEPADD